MSKGLVRSYRKPIVYFAGKISPHCWRTEIVTDLRGACYEKEQLLDPGLSLEEEGFIYGGPFFVSCDHCCSHGPAGHGALPSICTGWADTLSEAHAEVWSINKKRITRADTLFAYIDETDCYGTLVEIGFANALDKPIGIALGPNLTIEQIEELWMARISGMVDERDSLRDATIPVRPGPVRPQFEQFLGRVAARL